jgi:hypothetical protein
MGNLDVSSAPLHIGFVGHTGVPDMVVDVVVKSMVVVAVVVVEGVTVVGVVVEGGVVVGVVVEGVGVVIIVVVVCGKQIRQLANSSGKQSAYSVLK